ncbi:MAG: type III pantothenate kinase [Lentisphaerae bacterium]|nr:type III pantothenate kinase [Lentisphaerota bacterium]
MKHQRQERVIVVDTGNTSTSVAVFRGPRLSGVSRLPTADATAARIRLLLERMIPSIADGGVEGSVLGSVVPALNARWLAALGRISRTAPIVVHRRLRFGLRIDYPRQALIGADRLANACEAYARFGAPVVVADFGTALTFDVVSRAGAYRGGVIAPGVLLMTDYLAEKTALLPSIDIARQRSFFMRGRHSAIGRSTREAMLIGAKFGYAGMVREIVLRLRRELKAPDLTLCATGGYASWVLAGSGIPVILSPNLTLLGLRRIFALNRGDG